MPTLTITAPLPASRLDDLRAAFMAKQDDALTVRNALSPGLLAQVADAPLAQLATGRIPLLSTVALLEMWQRGLTITFDGEGGG